MLGGTSFQFQRKRGFVTVLVRFLNCLFKVVHKPREQLRGEVSQMIILHHKIYTKEGEVENTQKIDHVVYG